MTLSVKVKLTAAPHSHDCLEAIKYININMLYTSFLLRAHGVRVRPLCLSLLWLLQQTTKYRLRALSCRLFFFLTTWKAQTAPDPHEKWGRPLAGPHRNTLVSNLEGLERGGARVKGGGLGSLGEPLHLLRYLSQCVNSARGCTEASWFIISCW